MSNTMNMKVMRLAGCLCAASVSLWAWSLVLPVGFMSDHVTWRGSTPLRGSWYLMAGAVFCWVYNWAWLANPLTAVAVILFLCRFYQAAAIVSCAALAIAQMSWFCFWIGAPLDEAGFNYAYLTKSSTGFFVWMASIALLCAACLLACFQHLLSKPNNQRALPEERP